MRISVTEWHIMLANQYLNEYTLHHIIHYKIKNKVCWFNLQIISCKIQTQLKCLKCTYHKNQMVIMVSLIPGVHCPCCKTSED